MIARLTEAEFLATLREPIRQVSSIEAVRRRIAPHLPQGADIRGVTEAYDGLYAHVLLAVGLDQYLTVVIDNASGTLLGHYEIDLGPPSYQAR